MCSSLDILFRHSGSKSQLGESSDAVLFPWDTADGDADGVAKPNCSPGLQDISAPSMQVSKEDSWFLNIDLI